MAFRRSLGGARGGKEGCSLGWKHPRAKSLLGKKILKKNEGRLEEKKGFNPNLVYFFSSFPTFPHLLWLYLSPL